MTRRALVVVVLALGAGALSMEAVAWWTDSGTGSAAAAVGTLSVPGSPDVSVVASTATLNWTAATAPGDDTIGYVVERRETAGSIWSAACGTTASTPITALDCVDEPGDGDFVWRVTAFFRTWTATSGVE